MLKKRRRNSRGQLVSTEVAPGLGIPEVIRNRGLPAELPSQGVPANENAISVKDQPAGIFEPGFQPATVPPNRGDPAVPHVFSFRGFFKTQARVYRDHDEALKHSRENALIMWRDPLIRECIELRQRATALLDWHLEPEDEKSQDQADLVTAMSKIIEEVPRFTEYRRNLLNALWFGRYGIQNLYSNVKIGGKWRTAPTEWVPIHGDKLAFRYDDGTNTYNKNQIGIRVGGGFHSDKKVFGRLRFNPQGGMRGQDYWRVEELPRIQASELGLAYFLDDIEQSTVVVHKHQIEDGSWDSPIDAGSIHGVGIRSVIYWIWFQKQELQGILMDFLERSSTGVEIWTYPSGNSRALAEMEKAALERVAHGKNIIFFPRPLGDERDHYGYDIVFPNMAGANAIREIIEEYFGFLIKRYCLGQVLTTEAQSTGLGSNLASVHLNTFLQIVQYDARNLEETLTKMLVNEIKRQNFPAAKDIKIKFRIETSVQDVEARLAALQQAWQMGAAIPSKEVYDALGIARPEEDEDVLEQGEMGGLGGLFPGGGPPGGAPGASPFQQARRSARTMPRISQPFKMQRGEVERINAETYRYTHPDALPYLIQSKGDRWLITDEEGGKTLAEVDEGAPEDFETFGEAVEYLNHKMAGTPLRNQEEAPQWVPFEGPRGGKGWKNTSTGKVVYGDKPGDRKTEGPPSEEDIAAGEDVEEPILSDTTVRMGGGLPDEVAMKLSKWIQEADQEVIDGVDQYTGPSAAFLNEIMRECPAPNPRDCLEDEDVDLANQMDKAIELAGEFDEPVNTYRGVFGLDPEDQESLLASYRNSLDEGGPIKFKSFTSVSTDPDVAFEFVGEPQESLIYEIKAKTGAYVKELSRIPDQEEIVKSPETRYRVVGIKDIPYERGTVPTIQLEEI